MKKTRNVMALAMAAAMVLTGLTACGGGGKEASPATQAAAAGGNTEAAAAQPEGGSGEQKRIDVIAKGFQHQFWKAVEQGTQQAAAEFNVEVNFQGPDNESAIAQQVEYLNAAIANQPMQSAWRLWIPAHPWTLSSRLWKRESPL